MAPVASTFLPISRDSPKHSPRYRRASGVAYDAASAYRGGGGAPGRFAVGIHGAPL